MSSKVQQQQSNYLPARAILFLVHTLYSLLQQVLALYGWIRWKLSIYRRQGIAPSIEKQSEQRFENDAIEYGVRELSKIPSHLVVMLGPEVPDYKQLSKFIFWGMAAGVGHVSFYDHRGTLKRNHYQMLNHVSQQPRADSEQIVWTPQLKSANGLLPPKNGYRKRVVVSFFSPEDGKHQLTTLAQTISRALREGSIAAPADVTVELVDKKLQDRFHHLPDPELAVYFGDICSTYGMLPWQIRLTEFVPLEATRLGEVKIDHFINCLYKYAKCEQRFGK